MSGLDGVQRNAIVEGKRRNKGDGLGLETESGN